MSIEKEPGPLPRIAVLLSLAPLLLLALIAGTGEAAGQGTGDGSPLPTTLCEGPPGIDDAALATPLDELHRLREISGCAPPAGRLIRRAGPPATDRADGALFTARLLPTDLHAVNRSGYPDDRNNGALWEGAGISSAMRAGVQLQAPYLTLVVRPELLFQENRDFEALLRERVGYSPYASPFYTAIDLPTRFGGESWWELAPGDSYLRADVGWAAAGVSTESLWRGPAVRYPILMSSTAGGFPHLFLGTSRGVDVWVGSLSGELVWGRLSESDYFDETPDNDERGLVNVSLAFEPRWLTGLHLGFTRSYLYRPESDGLDPLLGTLGIASTTNRAGNELASLFGRWVFEEAGAEVYGEWARDDVLGTWREFLMEPDHSQAYMAGVQKVTRVAEEVSLRAHAEIAHLQEKGELRTNSRPMPVYYTHGQVRQGYTHRGQLLGAGIGPGADAQFVALDALWRAGTVGAYFERVRRNDQTSAALTARRWSPYEHDTEVTGGIRALYLRGPLAVSADLAHSFRYRRDFLGDERNWKTELRLGWSPDLRVAR